MYLAETIGRTALAEGEPGQNTRAKTKLTENVIGSLITESKHPWIPGWEGQVIHACAEMSGMPLCKVQLHSQQILNHCQPSQIPSFVSGCQI